MSRMKREIDRLRNRNAFENKKVTKQAVDFAENEVKKTLTDIIPPFRDFLEKFPDEFESSTVSSIKEDKKLDCPIDYCKLSHMT